MLPVPQRYYVPRRIKEGYRPRLEAVGLWVIGNEPEDRQEDRGIGKHHNDTSESKIKRAFGQAKVCHFMCCRREY
jgi:sorting and assembly machinery component 37